MDGSVGKLLAVQAEVAAAPMDQKTYQNKLPVLGFQIPS